MACLRYGGSAMIGGINVIELADTGITASNCVSFLGFGCASESDGLIAELPSLDADATFTGFAGVLPPSMRTPSTRMTSIKDR